jgi:hypothetical protein
VTPRLAVVWLLHDAFSRGYGSSLSPKPAVIQCGFIQEYACIQREAVELLFRDP